MAVRLPPMVGVVAPIESAPATLLDCSVMNGAVVEVEPTNDVVPVVVNTTFPGETKLPVVPVTDTEVLPPLPSDTRTPPAALSVTLLAAVTETAPLLAVNLTLNARTSTKFPACTEMAPSNDSTIKSCCNPM